MAYPSLPLFIIYTTTYKFEYSRFAQLYTLIFASSWHTFSRSREVSESLSSISKKLCSQGTARKGGSSLSRNYSVMRR
jgi:hypothetical protein